MNQNIPIVSIEMIDQAAKTFLKRIGSNKILAFHGQMGAGKTTFIKAICRELGVQEVINSPTFALVNEYLSSEKTPIYHFDFYRINQLQEAIDIGCDDYFYSNNLCFIEWPELVEALLPENTLHIYININEDNSREIIF